MNFPEEDCDDPRCHHGTFACISCGEMWSECINDNLCVCLDGGYWEYDR